MLMSFCTADEGAGSQRLKDVHQGLPASGVQNGEVHMVEGSYDYHHYMQVCLHWVAFTWKMATPNFQQLTSSPHRRADSSVTQHINV